MFEQKIPIRYSPHSGRDRMIKNQSAESYRDKNPRVLWRFDPWTGKQRSNGEMRSDPQGHAIVPPGEPLASESKLGYGMMSPPEGGYQMLPDPVPLTPAGQALQDIANDPECMAQLRQFGTALPTQIGGSHYKDLVIQPIEYIHKNGIGFAEGNVIKYVSRWRAKGGVQDLKKARHFLDLLIEMEEKK